MTRLVFVLLFALAFASTALTIRACTVTSTVQNPPSAEVEKLAILEDGSVMFAPNGTVTRELTDWLEQPDGDTRRFELGGIQFLGRSAEPTRYTAARLPRLAQMLKAYPEVIALLIGHTNPSGNSDEDVHLARARAEWVTQSLIKTGIATRRLTARGGGSAEPLFPPGSRLAGRNERVTLELSFRSHFERGAL